MKDLVTLRECAKMLRELGVSVPWLRAQCLDGRLPSLTVERGQQRKILVSPEAIREHLYERARPTVATAQDS